MARRKFTLESITIPSMAIVDDISAMTDEQAGMIFKMLCWKSLSEDTDAYEKQLLDYIELMKVCPDSKWLSVVYQRLDKLISEMQGTQKSKTENYRASAIKREEGRKAQFCKILHNSTEFCNKEQETETEKEKSPTPPYKEKDKEKEKENPKRSIYSIDVPKNKDELSEDANPEVELSENYEEAEVIQKIANPNEERGICKEIADYFNQAIVKANSMLPQVTRLSGQRKAFLENRLKEYGKESVLAVIDKAVQSDFLNGRNNKGWRADFAWIFRPNNFPKILEGNYDNRPTVQQQRLSESDLRHQAMFESLLRDALKE